MGSGFRGLGIAVEVHRFHLGAKRAGIWCYGRARRNGGGATRRRQGAGSVLAGPRRRCHGRALAWQGHAESQGALGGAERRSAMVCLLSAATGGPDAAEDAGEGGPACHRRQEEAKCACGAPDSRKRRRGTCQVHCEHVSEPLTKKTTLKSEFSEFAKEQCSTGVRQNVFGLWGFFLELIFGGVASHCSSRLPDFW